MNVHQKTLKPGLISLLDVIMPIGAWFRADWTDKQLIWRALPDSHAGYGSVWVKYSLPEYKHHLHRKCERAPFCEPIDTLCAS
jgi:hypothetical protein